MQSHEELLSSPELVALSSALLCVSGPFFFSRLGRSGLHHGYILMSLKSGPSLQTPS